MAGGRAWPLDLWILSTVSATTTTGPAGRVAFTRKSALRLPKSVARTRSPATTGRPSSRLPMYCKSRFEGMRPCGARTNFLGRRDGDRTDHGRLVQTRPGVLAGDAVDLQVLLAAMLLEAGEDFAHGLPLPLDFEHVAHVDAEPLHVGGIDPGDPASHVFGTDSLTRRVRSLERQEFLAWQ